MMVLLIFCILVAATLLYLLLAPFYLEVNSRENKCKVRFHRLAKARIYLSEESLFFELQIWGWHNTIDLLASKDNRVKVESAMAKKRNIRISIRKIYAVFKSFRLSTCSLTLDTGDMAMNGILYPMFKGLSKVMEKDIQINFYNKNEIVLVLKNNFYRVLRAYITN